MRDGTHRIALRRHRGLDGVPVVDRLQARVVELDHVRQRGFGHCSHLFVGDGRGVGGWSPDHAWASETQTRDVIEHNPPSPTQELRARLSSTYLDLISTCAGSSMVVRRAILVRSARYRSYACSTAIPVDVYAVRVTSISGQPGGVSSSSAMASSAITGSSHSRAVCGACPYERRISE